MIDPRPRMLDRRINKEEDSIVYHYCNSETLNAILENKCLRFSDLSTMNDSSEWVHGFNAFEQVIAKLTSELPAADPLHEFYKELPTRLREISASIIPMIACFSREPDRLSQWRSYADDGQGWAIGFQVRELQKNGSLLFEVCYDTERLESEVEEYVRKLADAWVENDHKFVEEINHNIHRIAILLTSYKAQAFSEEAEVRGYINIRVKTSVGGRIAIDKSAIFAEDKIALEEQVRFRSKGPLMVPYIDLPFPGSSLVSICELWRGPRNTTSDNIAQLLLHSHKLDECELKSSSASYRG